MTVMELYRRATIVSDQLEPVKRPMSDDFIEFLCNNCDHEFSEEAGLINEVGDVPCPECGSDNTEVSHE